MTKVTQDQRNSDVAEKSPKTAQSSADSNSVHGPSAVKLKEHFASSPDIAPQTGSCKHTETPETCQSYINSCIENRASPAKTGVQFTSSHCGHQPTSSSDLIKSTEHNADISSSKTTSVKLKVNASRNEFEQQDLFVPWHYRGQKKKTKGDGNLEPSCCCGPKLVDSKDGCVKESSSKEKPVFHRFYHVYKENELVDDCKKLSGISIIRKYYDKGNWCVELEKLGNKE